MYARTAPSNSAFWYEFSEQYHSALKHKTYIIFNALHISTFLVQKSADLMRTLVG